MNAIVVTVIPVFALIALGYAAGRLNLFSDAAEQGLSRFVFNFAIPAFLFRTMANVEVASAPWRLWAVYFGAAAVVWLLAIVASKSLDSIKGAGGASAAITSAFGNTVLMGIPLALAFFGERAALPAGLIVSIHAPVQWAAATLRAELAGGKTGGSIAGLLWRLVVDLARNPIVLAICAGSLWRTTQLGITPVVDRTIDMLGQAGIPTALFALGLSLTAFGFKGNIRGVAVLVALKMAVFPVVAALLAYTVFALGPVEAGVVVLFASLPSGVNAYLFASRFKAAVVPVSGAIAAGTAISLFSVSLVLWFIGP